MEFVTFLLLCVLLGRMEKLNISEKHPLNLKLSLSDTFYIIFQLIFSGWILCDTVLLDSYSISGSYLTRTVPEHNFITFLEV